MRALLCALSAALLFASAGCAASADGDELEPVEEAGSELNTVERLAGDYEEGRGRYASLSLSQVTEGTRTRNRFTAEQIVQCVRAPCPTVSLKGSWFARGSSLTLYPENAQRETFRYALESGRLTLTDASGVQVAELQKANPVPSDIAEILQRHGVPNLKVDIDPEERAAQERASGVVVQFKDAFDKAVELFLTGDDGLPGTVSYMEEEAREQCEEQTDLVLCLANDRQTSVSIQKRSDYSAPQGETAEDYWVFEFFTSHFTDHGYYAVINKSDLEDASVYSFN